MQFAHIQVAYCIKKRFGMIDIVHESYTGIWEFHI